MEGIQIYNKAQLQATDTFNTQRGMYLIQVQQKIKLELSREQLIHASKLMLAWLKGCDIDNDIETKALYYNAFKLNQSKFAKAHFNIKQRVKLSLDIAQACTIMQTICNISLPPDSYEYNLVNYIISQINRQTV